MPSHSPSLSTPQTLTLTLVLSLELVAGILLTSILIHRLSRASFQIILGVSYDRGGKPQSILNSRILMRELLWCTILVLIGEIPATCVLFVEDYPFLGTYALGVALADIVSLIHIRATRRAKCRIGTISLSRLTLSVFFSICICIWGEFGHTGPSFITTTVSFAIRGTAWMTLLVWDRLVADFEVLDEVALLIPAATHDHTMTQQRNIDGNVDTELDMDARQLLTSNDDGNNNNAIEAPTRTFLSDIATRDASLSNMSSSDSLGSTSILASGGHPAPRVAAGITQEHTLTHQTSNRFSVDGWGGGGDSALSSPTLPREGGGGPDDLPQSISVIAFREIRTQKTGVALTVFVLRREPDHGYCVHRYGGFRQLNNRHVSKFLSERGIVPPTFPQRRLFMKLLPGSSNDANFYQSRASGLETWLRRVLEIVSQCSTAQDEIHTALCEFLTPITRPSRQSASPEPSAAVFSSSPTMHNNNNDVIIEEPMENVVSRATQLYFRGVFLGSEEEIVRPPSP